MDILVIGHVSFSVQLSLPLTLLLAQALLSDSAGASSVLPDICITQSAITPTPIDRLEHLTISPPRSKPTKLDDVQDRTSSNASNILGRIRCNKNLSADRIADAVGDEKDSGGHRLFSSACDV